MKKLGSVVLVAAVASLSGCASDGSFDTNRALAAGVQVGAGVVQATMLDEGQVKQMSSLAAKEYDTKHKVAAANSQYTKRLKRLTNPLRNYAGLQLNFKVYVEDSINAFAMADGTVRVHSGLLDAMPDDQVLAVIGHEIGHVKLKHTYKQMRETLLADTVFNAAAASGGTIGALTSGQLGQVANAAVKAQFSQQDELDSDAFAVKLLRRQGKDPGAMKRAIQTLQSKYGSGGGFLSSHPSNDRRIENINKLLK